MAQKAQVIDLRKSYIPIDADSYQQNLVSTQKEDGEEKTLPITPYDGYNFLPTAYGYRSYFGTDSTIDLAALTSRAQDVIAYQLPNYKKRYIALCEDGIWISQDDKTWYHEVTHTYNSAIFEEWTSCFIENVLYMYKAGQSVVYKTSVDGSFVLTCPSFTPTFLNMAGQLGIFKAGTRLGMWDSSNSVSWSSTYDLTDFTPSLETLAGNTIFNALIGKIVTILNHGDAFIVYATKSIIGTSFNTSGNMLWDAREVFSNIGISHPKAVVNGAGHLEHYVYTTAGILHLGKYSPANDKYEVEWIFPELFDLLREARTPIVLDCIHKRYLCFSTFEDKYIVNTPLYEVGYVDTSKTTVTLSEGYWDGDMTLLPPCLDGNMLKTLLDQWLKANYPTGFAANNGGCP